MAIAQRPSDGPVGVVDIVGRQVSLPRPARRIVLGAWVSLDALSLLEPDPVGVLAGWAAGGANAIQPTILRHKFPAIDRVPIVGRDAQDTLSLEAILAAQPDLVVLSRFDAFRYGATDSVPPLVGQLEAAGVPVVIVDFFLDPLTNTVPSLRILGRLLGREDRAEAFIGVYEAHRDGVKRGLAAAGGADWPTVFFHAFADRADCCFSAGPGTVNDVIRAAGGRNLGAELLKGPVGQLSLEFVLARNPDAYVATAVSGGRAGAFALGPGVDAAEAAAGFAALTRRPELAALGAIAHGRAMGLWHLFVHTPVHIVALEALAKFLHPQSFADLDPLRTLDEINGRFLAVPLAGTFWTVAQAPP